MKPRYPRTFQLSISVPGAMIALAIQALKEKIDAQLEGDPMASASGS